MSVVVVVAVEANYIYLVYLRLISKNGSKYTKMNVIDVVKSNKLFVQSRRWGVKGLDHIKSKSKSKCKCKCKCKCHIVKRKKKNTKTNTHVHVHIQSASVVSLF